MRQYLKQAAQDVLGAPRVDQQRLERRVDDVAHPDRGRQVEHQLDPLDLPLDQGGVEDRAVHQPDAVEAVIEVGDPAGGQVVEHADLVAGVAQRVDEMRPDVAGAAGDENAHRGSVRPREAVAGPKSGKACDTGGVAPRYARDRSSVMPIDTELEPAELEGRVLEAIELIRPALQSDGGDIVFDRLDDDGVVHVEPGRRLRHLPDLDADPEGRASSASSWTAPPASPPSSTTPSSTKIPSPDAGAVTAPAAALLDATRAGDRGALARLLSVVEAGGDDARAALASLPVTGRRRRVDRRHHRRAGRGQVDPHRPSRRAPARRRASGWRCWRSTRAARSPAARSSATGCACNATPPIPTCSSARWRRAATSAGWRARRRRRCACSPPPGYGWIVVETVGVGQVEVEIAGAADTTVVVREPGLGRRRAGGQGGAARDRRRVRGEQGRPRRARRRPCTTCRPCSSSPGARPWLPPVLETVATEDRGVDDAARRGRATIGQHLSARASSLSAANGA